MKNNNSKSKVSNKLNKKELYVDQSKTEVILSDIKKQCINETPYIDKTILEIDKLYQDDVFKYTVSALDKRIAELEKIIKG